MNAFDKLCSCLSIPVGLVFLVLGVIGLFAGAQAQFTLPPVVGALPFFLGWGMAVVPIKAWRESNRRRADEAAARRAEDAF